MATTESRPRSVTQEADPTYKPLYRAGGIAAALMVLLTVLHSAVFFVVGLPTTILEWFQLFDRSALSGLLASELLLVFYVILSIPVALALYVALRKTSPSLMAIFVAVTLVGVMAFVASRPAFEMLSLSHGYALATTDAQRAAFLAAGEATYAAFDGTTFWLSYCFGSLGGLLLSAAILGSSLFGRATAYLRIASSVLDFGLFIPSIGMFISLVSVFCLLAFHVLLARRLLQMGR
jgi:hypothetical protein